MGERKLTAPEWTLYNILVLRFIERRKVREVAARLALSEPDLYRKQRLAIEVVADEVLTMEKHSLAGELPETGEIWRVALTETPKARYTWACVRTFAAAAWPSVALPERQGFRNARPRPSKPAQAY